MAQEDFSPLKINSGSNLSSDRIPRLRPNLQQFSCTFVKPFEAAIDDIPGYKLHKANDFKQVRQKERMASAYEFLHAVAYLE
jgi:hypothetical protein